MNKILFPLLLFAIVACNNKPKETIGENEFYVCSMDPQVLEKQQGMCPICKMPLAKVTIDKSELHLLRLNDDQIKLANIQTDTVRMDSIWEEKILTGVFAVDQNQLEQVSSRFNGRIEKLYFKIPGQEIKAGDLLYEVYSRDLMLAEEEFLLAVQQSKTVPSLINDNLLAGAKNRLLLWGLNESQMEQLKTNNAAQIINPIYSKVSGTITEIPFKEGDYIDEGSTIFKVANLTSLWVEAQVYSGDAGKLQPGDKVEVIPEAFPEEIMEGEVDFIIPELQTESRINLVRIKVPNGRKLMRPGMMALVVLKSKSHATITLPVNAVLHGKSFSHVWMRNVDGSFEARKVETGTQTNTRIEIISGINEGEVVVVSGAYLLYSDYVFKRGAYPLTGNIGDTMNKESVEPHDNMNH